MENIFIVLFNEIGIDLIKHLLYHYKISNFFILYSLHTKSKIQDKFCLLQSIFGDELRDLRQGKNKRKWQPLDIVITLTPQKGMSGSGEVHAQIDLHVTCNDKYPDE